MTALEEVMRCRIARRFTYTDSARNARLHGDLGFVREPTIPPPAGSLTPNSAGEGEVSA